MRGEQATPFRYLRVAVKINSVTGAPLARLLHEEELPRGGSEGSLGLPLPHNKQPP